MGPRHPIVLFDVMDTIVRDPAYDALAEVFGSVENARVAIVDRTAWAAFEKGEIDEQTYFVRAFGDRGKDAGPRLRDQIFAGYVYIAGMEELLVALRSRGVVMHILSNYPCWYRVLDGRLAVSRYLPWTFVSCLTGTRKPSPEAFTLVKDRLGCAFSDLLLVDDREENCRAARALGLLAVRFENAAILLSYLDPLV
jgi:HAD superfamily hydrolase (TIGR01509 family)